MRDLQERLVALGSAQQSYILEDLFLILSLEARYGDEFSATLVKLIERKVKRWEEVKK